MSQDQDQDQHTTSNESKSENERNLKENTKQRTSSIYKYFTLDPLTNHWNCNNCK